MEKDLLGEIYARQNKNKDNFNHGSSIINYHNC